MSPPAAEPTGHHTETPQIHPGSASAEAVPLLEEYLDEQAADLHRRCGDIAGAAVTLAVNGKPITVGSSTDLARRIDHTQYEIGVGPCLSALLDQITRYVPDLAADPEWAPYGGLAAELGARCCISVPVIDEDVSVAVVKVYGAEVDGLDQAQQQIAMDAAVRLSGGLTLARHLVQQAHELDHRVAAMNSRRSIDVAIGLLMERVGCSADSAFELLRRQSQRTNVKLRDAATEMVLTKDPDFAAAPFRHDGAES